MDELKLNIYIFETTKVYGAHLNIDLV